MAVQFSEIQAEQVEPALLSLAERGTTIALRSVRPWESIAALDKKGPAGYAIAHKDDAGRHLTICTIDPKDAGLARKLLDQGLAKTSSAGLCATHITIQQEDADAQLWGKANWLNSLPKFEPAAR